MTQDDKWVEKINKLENDLIRLERDFENQQKNAERTIDDMKDLIKELKKQHVTRSEFQPVQKVVYGVVSMILIAVVTALITLVLK